MKKARKMRENKSHEISIPHMGYKILYGVNSKEFKDRLEHSVMFCEDTNKNTSSIIFRETPTNLNSGAVAHEIVHALQFLCRRRNMRMEDETEHMGYLMQYIFNEIYDRVYDPKL